MAHQTLEDTYSLPAAADLRTKQFQAVVINGSALIALCGAGALPESVLQNVPASGAMALLVTRSRYVGKILLGTGGITLGAKMVSDANGKGIAGATTGHKYFAKALQAGAAGDIVTAFFDFSGAYGAVP